MYVKVKAYPGAKKEVIKEVSSRMEIYVKDDAQRGAANIRIRFLVAQYYNVPVSKVYLLKGHTSQNKIFEILE
ncbi:MAG: hypothetical protein ACI83D_000520 [Planctomycetota bacterium]|jgi:uncharacterized protein YggU (UPF0235/DUF167 family)